MAALSEDRGTPLLVLKTKDLQHDYAQSRANNRLIRKVAEIQELPELPCSGRWGFTGCLLVVKERDRASSRQDVKEECTGARRRVTKNRKVEKTKVTKLS